MRRGPTLGKGQAERAVDPISRSSDDFEHNCGVSPIYCLCHGQEGTDEMLLMILNCGANLLTGQDLTMLVIFPSLAEDHSGKALTGEALVFIVRDGLPPTR